MQFKRITLIFLLVSLSSSSFAQVFHKSGARLGVLFGQSILNLEFDDGTFPFEDKEETNVSVIYLGYQKVASNKVGFSTAVSYSHLSGADKGGDINNIMLEANATYGFGNSSTHLFGGANVSKFGFENDFSAQDDIGYGVQAGFGFQVLKYLAVDLRYLYTSQTIMSISSEKNVKTNGYRLGALYSF